MQIFKGYKSLLVWQVGMELVEHTYKISEMFPARENFSLTSQMRRAAVSIPSNIAEGYRRKTNADFLQFLRISFGSASELETQMLIAVKLNYLTQKEFEEFDITLSRFMQLMTRFIQSKQIKDQ
jgi:four helix bundle protein